MLGVMRTALSEEGGNSSSQPNYFTLTGSHVVLTVKPWQGISVLLLPTVSPSQHSAVGERECVCVLYMCMLLCDQVSARKCFLQ